MSGIVTRRGVLGMAAMGLALPRAALAEVPLTIDWMDLIPPGVPYGQIVGPGEIYEEQDLWFPQFDENAVKVNPALDGALIRMPGFTVPLVYDDDGTTEFLLVPFVGACIHVPPPPPNQLVVVRTETPWPSDSYWEAVWVTGMLTAHETATAIADAGYLLQADGIEDYYQ